MPVINPSLVLVQPRKTRPYITERLLMGRKESNQTNKINVTSNISEMKTLMPFCYTECSEHNGDADQGADECTLDIFFLMGKYTFV